MAISWNAITANFNDANTALSNSSKGWSEAGTIFGNLRKAILDEEQRAIDNAYREKEFDRKSQQWQDQFDWNRAIWDKDYARKLEEFDRTQQRLANADAETARHNRATEGISALNAKASLANLDLQRQLREDQLAASKDARDRIKFEENANVTLGNILNGSNENRENLYNSSLDILKNPNSTSKERNVANATILAVRNMNNATRTVDGQLLPPTDQDRANIANMFKAMVLGKTDYISQSEEKENARIAAALKQSNETNETFIKTDENFIKALDKIEDTDSRNAVTRVVNQVRDLVGTNVDASGILNLIEQYYKRQSRILGGERLGGIVRNRINNLRFDEKSDLGLDILSKIASGSIRADRKAKEAAKIVLDKSRMTKLKDEREETKRRDKAKQNVDSTFDLTNWLY